MTTRPARIDWQAVLNEAGQIVRSYDTPVTLRQLFYRLVAAQLLQNTQSAYTSLSSRTAKARRNGDFPQLLDNTRRIERHLAFSSPDEAKDWLKNIYRRDRTEGQEWNIYLGVEKATVVAQLDAWFGDLGLPILALRGYSSQTFKDEVRRDILDQQRPAVLLYAGDLDPSGEDIDRDFVHGVGCFDKTVRIALTANQAVEFNLPPQPGKKTDTRSATFVKKHGALFQIEIEALDPDILRELYQHAIDDFFDTSTFDRILDEEADDRSEL